MKPKSTLRLLAILSAFLLLLNHFNEDGYAEEAHQAEMHMGEDGVAYPLENQIKRSNWMLGKIEPILFEASQTEDELNIIVVFQTPDMADVIGPVKSKHKVRIDQLSNSIKSLEQRYRPKGSLTPEEERTALPAIEMSRTAEEEKQLKLMREELDENRDVMREEIGMALNDATDSARQSVANQIISLGGRVVSGTSAMGTIGAVIPSQVLLPLANNAQVVSILKNRPTELELDVSVPSCDYDAWWDDVDVIDGGAYDLGIVDTGVQQNHPAFSGVSFYTDSGSSSDSSDEGHGTHCTGIVASAGTTYRGGAYGLDGIIWSSSSGGQANVIDHMEWQAASAGQHPEVINHSLGYGIADDTNYSDMDAFYDAFVDYYDIMVSKSAGNAYWDDTDPTITHPAPSYNILVVANMDDRNTLDRTDDVRRFDSSVGPTLSGRKKPDIAAPGTNIMSTNNSWSGTGSGNPDPNCWDDYVDRQGYDWSRCSGTSMSAPHVAAAIILMEDGGNHTPMAQKAVLLNTADAWDSNDTSGTGDDGPVMGSHWDKSYGWGYLDMWEAHYNRSDYFVDSLVPRNDTAAADDYHLYKGQMYRSTTEAEKATLVWQKRSNYVAGDPPTTMYFLSDLNIRLYNELDGSQLSSDLDSDDNVHQVDMTGAASGWHDVVVKVYSWSTGFSGSTSEPYALATEENFTTADPPSFQRNYSRPNYVGPYQTFNVTVRIFNNGDVTAHDNTVTLQDIAGITVNGDNSQSLDSILPGPYPDNPQATIFSLTTSGATAGTHWLPLDFDSNCYLETYTYSTASGVSVIVETTPPTSSCTAPAYDNLAPIPVNWSAADSQTGVNRTYLYAKSPGSAVFVSAGLSSTGTSGSFNYTPSAGNGLYQFAVRSVDNGGNWEAVPTVAEDTTFYDTVPPYSGLWSPAYDVGGPITISYSATDPSPSSGLEWVDFWYKKGSGGVWTYTGQYSTASSGTINFTPSAGDGVYYFASRAKDNAQNIEDYPSGGDDSTIYDTIAPTGAIAINGNAATTASLVVTLNLKAVDATSGVYRMQFSNDNTSWSPWEAFQSTRTGWDLSAYGGDASPGTKSTFVRFQDRAGHVSPSYSDTIEYDDSLMCEGDFDGDHDVDEDDLSVFAADFGRADCTGPSDCPGDFGPDGDVDGEDLTIFAADFGRIDCP